MNNLAQIRSQFEKDINQLNTDDVLKIIDRVNTPALREFKNNKNILSKYLFVSENGDFVIMFFYHKKKELKALQYIIDKRLDDHLINALCELFSASIIKMLAISSVKNIERKSELNEYYTRQIRGYKQYLKGQNNAN